MKQKGFYAERQDNEMQSTIQVYSWLHQFQKITVQVSSMGTTEHHEWFAGLLKA